jgi:uncharacterized OB-fold protein
MSDSTMEDYGKPVPEPSNESRPFWAGLHQHRLLLQRCTQCFRVRHYPRPVCDACYSMQFDWIEASGRGTIHSWTVTHHAFHFGFKRDLPYVTVVVDLEEGVRMNAILVDGPQAPLAIGAPVAIVYDDVTADLTLPRFRLTA